MKKTICLMLIVLMLATFCVPAFATNFLNPDNLESVIAAEIQSEQERIFSSVYAQLEQQDAVSLMDTYVEILTPKIEASVYASYGLEAPSSLDSQSYTLRNGGSIGFNSISDSVVLDVYFTAEQFEAYQEKQSNDRFSLSDIFGDLFDENLYPENYADVITGWGAVYEILVGLTTIANSLAMESVNEAGGYAEIINVSAAGGTEQGSTLVGWTNYPTGVVPTGARNIQVEYFT